MARILVADDEEGIRSFVAEVLEMEGHTVLQAENGTEAANFCKKQSFSLVITDLKMPGLDGIALLHILQKEQPETEVIMITAHGTVSTAVEAMKLGAFDYIEKPVKSPTELRLLVRRALEHRTLLDEKTAKERLSPKTPPLSYGDPVMKPVVHALEKVARTPATVLLLGESGTGKEVAATMIHQHSKRANGPFMAVNCAALSDQLLESELFGHEKGAFTSAHATKRGRIELAQGGTFFLDEVGELKSELQAKLLRVLEERRFERIGGTRTIEADVRWIAATNRNLKQMIQEGSFREDLFHRLSVFPIKLPPLRERKVDLPHLIRLLLLRVGESLGRKDLQVEPDALEILKQSSWPGNIRELKNVLERAAILTESNTIELEHLWLNQTGSAKPQQEESEVLSLSALEQNAIEKALKDSGGNRKQAAKALGIGLRTLYDKLKRYNIS